MSVISAYIVPHPPLIIPDVGGGQEKIISKTYGSYDRCAREIADSRPDTIIIISPHTTVYADYFHISPGTSARGDMSDYRAPDASAETGYDTRLRDVICEEAEKAGIPAGTLGETQKRLDHASLIPIWFLHKYYTDHLTIRTGFSGMTPLEHYRYGKCIARSVEKTSRRAVVIASGDLSHRLKPEGPYGFAEEGPEFDREITDAMADADFLRFLTMPASLSENAGECGLRSFQIMAGIMDGLSVDQELLSYEGPFGVGYAVASFKATGKDPSRCFEKKYIRHKSESLKKIKNNESPIVDLARYTLETYVTSGRKPEIPPGTSEELLKKQAGVFVSLKKEGILRGCIGTIGPVTDCIAEEVMRNAVSAGTEDPRFPPVTSGELADLVYSVDVLGAPESIASSNQLNPKRYGVIVSSGRKRGLLLPDLDGIDDPEKQIKIASEKAGILPGEEISLERFEVIRHR